jgi:opacity protein-like surface antigen
MKPLLLLLLAAAALPAQPVSFGLKGGVPLTDFISTVGNNPSLSAIEHPQRYLLGPTVELKLPFRFALEADVLYRRVNYQTVASTKTTSATSQVTSNAWEFPILLKYRLAGKKFVRPYIDAGVAFDRLQGLTGAVVNGVNPLKNSGTTGAVLGAGLDVHVLVLHISPEIRYTRWTSQHFNLANVLASQQNQAEVMVGITF